MRFLINNFKVIEACSPSEAVVAFFKEYPTIQPPMRVAIVGEDVKYQLRSVVERVDIAETVTES